MRKTLMAAGIGVAVAGCGLLAQVQQLATFTQCQFRLSSVTNTALAGVTIQDKHTIKDLSAFDAIRLAAALRGGTIPLSFTVNVEGRNPNAQPAAMNALAWIFLVDDREMTRGNVDRRIEIAANGGTAVVPVEVAVDLRTVLRGDSLESMKNLAFNIAGQGAHSTRITVKLKPSILVLGQSIVSPDYFTVSTEFGGAPR